MTTIDSQCVYCTHLAPVDSQGRNVCEAFPQGIPEAIYLSQYDHRYPYPGDHDIRLELDEPSWQGHVSDLLAAAQKGSA